MMSMLKQINASSIERKVVLSHEIIRPEEIMKLNKILDSVYKNNELGHKMIFHKIEDLKNKMANVWIDLSR